MAKLTRCLVCAGIVMVLSSIAQTAFAMSLLSTQVEGLRVMVSFSSILVSGTFEASEPEVGVVVSGFPAAVHENRFAVLALVEPKISALSVLLTGGSGRTVAHSVPISLSATPFPTMILNVRPSSGPAPLTAEFSLDGEMRPAHVTLDADGDGKEDFSGAQLHGQPFTYRTPGLYIPRVSFDVGQGRTQTVYTVIEVYDQAKLDRLLQMKWTAMKDALKRGDVNKALDAIALMDRERYREVLTGLLAQSVNIDHVLTEISFVSLDERRAEYQMIRIDKGVRLSHFVLFVKDADGIWRLHTF